MMDMVLHDLGAFTANYINDTVIFSESWNDHLKHFTQVLCCLREANLRVKLNWECMSAST